MSNEDNVVDFATKQKALNEENSLKLLKDFEETVRKAFSVRDHMLRTVCNDVMSLNVNIAAALRILVTELGIPKKVVGQAVKTELEEVNKTIQIMEEKKTLRERLEAAQEANLLDSMHFDGLHMIDESDLSEDEKVALAKEFGLIHES